MSARMRVWRVDISIEGERYRNVLPTTWKELLDRGLITSFSHNRYQLTTIGWRKGVQLLELDKEPAFRGKLSRLAATLKDQVKGRHEEAYLDIFHAAQFSGLPEDLGPIGIPRRGVCQGPSSRLTWSDPGPDTWRRDGTLCTTPLRRTTRFRNHERRPITPMNPAPALVLFDIDGTLVRRAGPHHRQALIDAVRRVTGLETTTDRIPVHGMLDQIG